MIRRKQGGTASPILGSGEFEFVGYRQRTITGNVTLADSDMGSAVLVNGAGAVTVTLPLLPAGSAVLIINLANQNLTVQSAPAAKVVTLNNAAANSVAFSTGGQLIGGCFECVSIDTGGGALKWFIQGVGSNTVTVA